MAVYRKPLDDSSLFNERNYISNNESIGSSSNSENINIDLTKYLKIDGSNSMSGIFNTPTIQLFGEGSKIIFQDGTELTSINDIEDSGTVDEARIVDISHNMTTLTTTISNNCYINNLTAGTFTLDNKNVKLELDKISKISYDPTNFLTTINNNTYIDSLSAGNFNTTHLANTSSNIQNQINNNVSSINNNTSAISLNTTKLTNQTFNNNLTTISNNTHINNLTTGNFNTSHLSNTTSNIQTQLNNLQAQIFVVYYDKQYTNFDYGAGQGSSSNDGIGFEAMPILLGSSLLQIGSNENPDIIIPNNNLSGGRIVMVQTSFFDNNNNAGISFKQGKFYRIFGDLKIRPFERAGNKSILLKFLSVQIYLSNTSQTSQNNNTAKFATDEKILLDYSNITSENILKTFNYIGSFESIIFNNSLTSELNYNKATIVLRYEGVVNNDSQNRILIKSNLSIIEL